MRIATFLLDGEQRLGIVRENEIWEVPDASGAPVSMLEFVRAGNDAQGAVAEAAGRGRRIDLAKADVIAPIPEPIRNIICVGKNYRAHAAEFHGSGFDAAATVVPAHPVFFTKAPSSVIGPSATIRCDLDETDTTDYEGELAVVIGRGGRGISASSALDHVFGYTILNDVTSRELQRRHGQWFLGKSLDTYCPMGPWIVTADEIPDPSQLRLSVTVNGEPRQSASLSDLIFDIPSLIETLSHTLSLEAGDIIATGTPAGVGIGYSPPRFLRSGDTVSVCIDGIGELVNPVSAGR